MDRLTLAVLASALLAGCASPPPASPSKPESRPDPLRIDPDPVEVAGLRFDAPAGWVHEPSPSAARVAQYRLPAPAREDATLVVYHFGPGAGSIDANMERWAGQFEQPDGRDSRNAALITGRAVNGLRIDTIDVSGTYVAETFPGSGERVNHPDQRMLAAVVGTEAGPYYVKLVGPSHTVTRWQAAYDAFLDSMAPAPLDGLRNADARHP